MVDVKTLRALKRSLQAQSATNLALPRAPDQSPNVALWIVGITALIIHALAVSASRLWLYPDSRWYLELSVAIVDHLDLGHELFLIRPAGYPAVVAGLMALFSAYSAAAILIVQHAMVCATGVLAALTAWYTTSSRWVTLLAGLLCACSLQLTAWANVLMTEATYTLLLVAAVCLLVRFHRQGDSRWLIGASALAGVGYLVRPVGILTVVFCVVAAVHRAWMDSAHEELRTKVRCWVALLCLAIVPALVAAAPRMAHSAWLRAKYDFGGTMGLVMFNRAAGVEELDCPSSEALRDIDAVVAEAKLRGLLDPDDRIVDWFRVRRLYETVRGTPLGESSLIISQAGRDLFDAHRWLLLRRTFRQIAWAFLIPDGTYRFQPGGKHGDGYFLAKDAEILSIDSYDGMLQHELAQHKSRLPLRADATPTTPLWTTIARWYYRHIDRGPPLLGIGDSPYEAYVWLCFAGMAAAMLSRRRMTFLIIAGVIFVQVFVSVFLAGSQPRYAMPTAPLLNIFMAWAIVSFVRGIIPAIRHVTSRSRRRTAWT